MSDAVWIGIDLGTQSVRAIAADGNGELLATASHPLAGTRRGVEHEQNPWDWWRSTTACCRQVMSDLGSRAVDGIAVDATSGTILLTDEHLNPVTPSLMYDDGRAGEEAEVVNAAGKELWEELGYRMQPSWALPKLLWLVRHYPKKTSVRLTHQNDFINSHLTGRATATDSSHSLKSGYDLLRSRWPVSILETLGLSERLFPPVVRPGTPIGEIGAAASSETGIPVGTKLIAGMTDGCAAQIAAGATTIGSWNSVLGTTLVLKGATRERLVGPLGVVYSHRSSDGLWLPGGASSTGAGVIAEKFRDCDLDALNRSAAAAGPSDLVVYPLSGKGERFPFSATEAEGFTIGTPVDRESLYVGILQGVAFIERLAFESMEMLGAPMNGKLTFTGGATRSAAWNRIRTNILGREVSIPAVTEGAFGMAVLAASHDRSLAEATRAMVRIKETMSPDLGLQGAYAERYERLLQELQKRGWISEQIVEHARAKAVA